MEGFVIVLRDRGALAATSTPAFGATLDVYLTREDAEFAARTQYLGRPLEVRRVRLEVQ